MGGSLRISVKELGDFTKTISGLPQGSPVLIDGPHGIFTLSKSHRGKILAIAGGIGITPIRSLCEEAVKKGKDVVLLFSSKFVGDIPLRGELEDLVEKYPNFKLTLVLTEDQGWKGERGPINLKFIEKKVSDYREREIFLCGPGSMLKSIRSELQGANYSMEFLHTEEFAW